MHGVTLLSLVSESCAQTRSNSNKPTSLLFSISSQSKKKKSQGNGIQLTEVLQIFLVLKTSYITCWEGNNGNVLLNE